MMRKERAEERQKQRLLDREKYLNERREVAEKRKQEQKKIDDLKPIKPKSNISQKSDIKYSKMWTETNNGFLEIYASLIGLEHSRVLIFGTKDAEAFKEGWNKHRRYLKK